MANKHLGKGLDALLGNIQGSLEPDTSTGDSREVPIHSLKPNPNQPRQVFNDESLDSLADSVREQGIISPLVVRRLPDDSLQIIAGERRWRAARIVGLDKVPILEREADETQVVVLGLVENLQREDLTAFEAAKAIQHLQTTSGLTHEEIANLIGKSRSSVTNLLRLLSLEQPVLDFLKEGELEEASARTLLSLTPSEQIRAARRVIKEGMSVRQAENLVKRILAGKPSRKAKDPNIKMLEEDLSDNLGSTVSISQRSKTGRGTLRIQYRNLEQLQSIIERLRGS